MSHKEENGNMENKNNPLFLVIIVLLVVIAILAFFLGRNLGGGDNNVNNNNNNNGNTVVSETGLVAEAVKIGLDAEALTACVASDKYESLISEQQGVGSGVFGVTGTPGSVLINNETGEYDVISGAYPTESFVAIIDKLLAPEVAEGEAEEEEAAADESPVVLAGADGAVKVTIIDDVRCTSCQTDGIIQQLKEAGVAENISFEKVDFSNPNAQKILEDNEITLLPAVIFSTNEVNDDIKQYLTEIKTGEYALAVGSQFNPNAERSAKGFLIVDLEVISSVKEKSYIKGNENAKITWLEYSDLECPYCQKLHQSSTFGDLTTKYGEDINIIYNHFPLDFHDKAIPGAKLLECAGEQGGSEAFYSLLDTAYRLGIQE